MKFENRIVFLKMVSLSLGVVVLSTSCSSVNTNKIDSSTGCPSEQSISSDNETETWTHNSGFEETVIFDCEVNSLSISCSLDEFLDSWVAVLGIENSSLSEDDCDNPNDSITYYSDYSLFLSDAAEEFDSSGSSIISLEEYDYHIVRAFIVDYHGFCAYEFDDAWWSEEAFSSDLHKVLSYPDEITVFNYADVGCFFAKYDNENYYLLEYLVGDCLITYHFSLYNGTEELQLFNCVCDACGLPHCQELEDELW